MDSRTRVRDTIQYHTPDRVPVSFNATDETIDRLKKRLSLDSEEALLKALEIDVAYIAPDYIGPEMKSWKDASGNRVEEHIFGWHSTYHWSGGDYTPIVSYYPLDEAKTIADIEAHDWPDPDWFDYEGLKDKISRYPDLALMVGNIGNYQVGTKIRNAQKLYMDMALEPEFAKALFKRFHDFEMQHYERILQAGKGRIDILRVYDDYGTQGSMLFSLDMWREFFKESTRALADLAHSYGAYYMQHSCGAVGPIIEELISCGVDILDPLQKVAGLEPETLREAHGNRIAYHGGIDTQHLLPSGSPEEVSAEVDHYVEILGRSGGYILSPSQAFQGDIPLENILEMYRLAHR